MQLTKIRSRFNEDWLALTLTSLFVVVFALSGCVSYGVIDNTPLNAAGDAETYSIHSFAEKWRTGDIELMLAFSGGGTRAAVGTLRASSSRVTTGWSAADTRHLRSRHS